MRILYVGNFVEGQNGAQFYNVTRKLVNGFTRNGHTVYAFSERDIARASTPLGSKAFGARAMNRRLLETVERFDPQLIVLAHADLVERATLETIRARPGRPRILLRNVDPLFIDKTITNIERYVDLVDAVFVTTAGEALKRFSRPNCVVGFIPNPADRAIDSFRAFETEEPAHHVFYATRYTRFSQRIAWCEEMQRRLPDVRFDFRGFGGKPAIFGIEFYRAIAQCRMGLNLDKEQNWYLYSSARIAQYVGNGLLTFVHRGSGYGDILTDDELGFFDDLEDLISLIARYAADDERARAVARRGWEKYHALFSTDLVTRYMIEATFREAFSTDYVWPTTLY